MNPFKKLANCTRWRRDSAVVAVIYQPAGRRIKQQGVIGRSGEAVRINFVMLGERAHLFFANRLFADFNVEIIVFRQERMREQRRPEATLQAKNPEVFANIFGFGVELMLSHKHLLYSCFSDTKRHQPRLVPGCKKPNNRCGYGVFTTRAGWFIRRHPGSKARGECFL